MAGSFKHIVVGEKSGELEVLERAGRVPNTTNVIWRVRCSCGSVLDLTSTTFRIRKSCPKCAHARGAALRIRHGESKKRGRTSLYSIWQAMRSRCGNPKSSSYRWYGGKGIVICEGWQRFEAFRDWAVAAGYAPGLTIDRVDSTAAYCPENCRWTSQAENSRLMRQKYHFVRRDEALGVEICGVLGFGS